MAYYKRKSPRIPNYDYSTSNCYFLTVCTHNRRCIFGNPGNLNVYGLIAEEELLQLKNRYEAIHVDKYVVMPNHIHMIVTVEDTKYNPDIQQVIAQYKSGVSRKIHQISADMKIWQRSFHDHIIRNQNSYEQIWNYIEGNPLCWEKDCFYVDQSMMQ